MADFRDSIADDDHDGVVDGDPAFDIEEMRRTNRDPSVLSRRNADGGHDERDEQDCPVDDVHGHLSLAVNPMGDSVLADRILRGENNRRGTEKAKNEGMTPRQCTQRRVQWLTRGVTQLTT
jgi:hypothetical protein